MRKIRIYIMFAFCGLSMVSQNKLIDERYLEDQLYLGLTYNSFKDTPTGLSQNGISFGTSLGFIKDIPFNKRRNFGLGLGVGYSYNSFNTNLLHNQAGNDYAVSVSDAYDTNIINYSSLEIPVEIRWRTSTYDKYKFWRIYGGVNFSYMFASKTKYTLDDTSVVIRDNKLLRKLQYGLSLAVGYNTWNLYMNYSLTSLYASNLKLEGTDEVLQIKPLRLGVMFYLL
ncbi:porin family protein [Flavicella sediminum]|uniref:porin family protein n=1 Tax=Flavicella sediminum TaxID=2585141 RepID=UPI001123D014|nr:porin family protein [Flavicella sediminum]